MFKRIVGITIGVLIAAAIGVTGFGIVNRKAAELEFTQNGSVLLGNNKDARELIFDASTAYTGNGLGDISFKASDGNKATVSKQSFVNFDDGSKMALSDGVLMDFNDLSDNFINNYFVPANVHISTSGSDHVISSGTGDVTVGDYMWKLSDNKYLIASPTLSVYFSDDDIRDTEDYVQVTISDSGIVYLLTKDNLWTTISADTHIVTESGVTIYPLQQIITNEKYSMDLAKLTVNQDDNIVLSEQEQRRQIVPKFNIDAVDGEDGADGLSGMTGSDGTTGQSGSTGEEGEAGTDGDEGVAGEEGSGGSDGSNGSSGANGSDNTQKGETGAAGVSGVNGANGGSGVAGSSGTSGTNGINGTNGKDAIGTSSANSALPTFSLISMSDDEESVKNTLTEYGEITVSDVSEFLSSSSSAKLGDADHHCTISIINPETGNKIKCYSTNSDYKVESDPVENFDDVY